MIEENGPECSVTAGEVKDAMDKEVLYRWLGAWHRTAQDESETRAVRTEASEVGLLFYLIIARFIDLDPRLAKPEACGLCVAPHEAEAFYHYRAHCRSIEVVKEGYLQKVNFHMQDPGVVRNEIKDKMIWDVDRTSPSNKIRDMIIWSKDILNDISYQRRIMGNPIANFITKRWSLWNHLVLLISLAINVLMLVTWNAPASLDDAPANGTDGLPTGIDDPMPVPWIDHYQVIIWALGGTHNLLSLILVVSYFMANRPRLPRIPGLRSSKKKKGQDSDDDLIEEEHASNIRVNLLSFATLYYLLFLAASGAGTYFHGYFFAFHLLNIITTNQLLKGVIQAVTKNGRSLLWVLILGLIIFYIYGLISFAFLRASFDPKEDHMYCATLWQCTITIIRYGLIGDLFDYLQPNDDSVGGHDFFWFGMYVIFNLSFFIFITTIGLNIIFGIIVDTFSELRDLKWQTEQDIRENCFICSRSSYDFEHYGNGFSAHVNQEHDLWAYVYFFIHLHDTKPSDYTAIEKHVATLMEKNKGDFFPLHRAMSLQCLDEDTTQNKIEELHTDITKLVDNQQKEEQKRKHEVERVRLLKWRDKHRQKMPPVMEEQEVVQLHPKQANADGHSTQTQPSEDMDLAIETHTSWPMDTEVYCPTQAVQTVDIDIMNFSGQTEQKVFKNCGVQTEDYIPEQASHARNPIILAKLDMLMRLLEEQPPALQRAFDREPMAEHREVQAEIGVTEIDHKDNEDAITQTTHSAAVIEQHLLKPERTDAPDYPKETSQHEESARSTKTPPLSQLKGSPHKTHDTHSSYADISSDTSDDTSDDNSDDDLDLAAEEKDGSIPKSSPHSAAQGETPTNYPQEQEHEEENIGERFLKFVHKFNIFDGKK